ncbi:MAG TPA: NfeD family protein [Aeromicrobium sp.]|nr:NfeD family protein [Aeromicrobium sp.]
MDWFGSDIWLTWVALGVFVGLIELSSGELIFLMFSVAAFASAAAAGLGASVELQLVVFGVVATALLSLVRPRIAARVHDGPTLPSGQHGLVGELAIVAEEISRHGGRIQVGDVYWTARPVDPDAIYVVGEELVVTDIDGAVAHVERKGN